jgi:hypothetical protein
MLINQRAGSGGDCFPYYFREAKLGPLIGVRTWGGLVGIGDLPPMLDGASVSVPSFAFYELDGTWGVEGYGVAPDIEVIDDPARMVNGAEPQLEKAIELMLAALEKDEGFELKPVPPVSRPQRHGTTARGSVEPSSAKSSPAPPAYAPTAVRRAMDIAQRPWLRCRGWLAWTPLAAQCAGLAREGGLRPGATFAALGHTGPRPQPPPLPSGVLRRSWCARR